MTRAAKRVVVTLHEYSSLPVLQRASTHLFRWTADCLLFTAEAELMSYGRSSVMQQIIHIGSNVPAFPLELPRTPTVLYFGQIRPGKGLEKFLELARHSFQLARPFRYRVTGSVSQRCSAYYKTIRTISDPKVEWLIDLPFDKVAQLMTSSLAAYLPFPDYASYRRGSLLAALTNGLPTITTVGTNTPDDMMEVLLPAASVDEALAHLDRLYKRPDEADARGRAGRVFAAKFSWTQIAQQHEQAYNAILSLARKSRKWPIPYLT
jgi:glycosyltransferase involved in cell wall biosynthesis